MIDKKKYLTVALTGGFGSGKSTVADMFADMGAGIVDADRLARQVLESGSEEYRRVREEFGDDILLPGSEEIDRKRLARIVFNSPKKISILNSIVHPAVIRKIDERIAAMNSPVRIAVIPLLYETGLEGRFDRVIAVAADPETVRRRVGADRGMNKEEIQKRQSAQLPPEEKEDKADFIINNNHSLSRTRNRVGEVWRQLCRIIQYPAGSSK